MNFFYSEGGEAVEQVAQRAGGYPIPRNIQGQAERLFEQPDLVENVTRYYRKNWSRWSLKVPSSLNYSLFP